MNNELRQLAETAAIISEQEHRPLFKLQDNGSGCGKYPCIPRVIKPGDFLSSECVCQLTDTPRGYIFITEREIPPGGIYNIVMEEMEKCPHCSGKHKTRTEEEKKKLLNRLKKAEGQIRGIEKMVEDDMYCPDILIQVSAITSALNSFNKELLACHIRSCVAEDIREGKDETIDELVSVLQKLMK